jgi:hypothetical protein
LRIQIAEELPSSGARPFLKEVGFLNPSEAFDPLKRLLILLLSG